MTISSTTRKAGPFVGNGVTTEFPFDFKLFATSDLRVVRADALGVETDLAHVTDCTVTLNADQDENPGGSVVLNAPLADGFRLVLLSAVPELQPVDLTNQGGFYPELVNGGLDRATVQVQQLREEMGRSIRLPVTADAADLQLPAPQPGQLVGWANSGLVNYDPSELVSIVAYGDAKLDKFEGDGSAVAFALTVSPGALNNLRVSIDGVVQTPGDDFSWGGGTALLFTVAPPAGTAIVVQYQEALQDIGGATEAGAAAGAAAANAVVETKLEKDGSNPTNKDTVKSNLDIIGFKPGPSAIPGSRFGADWLLQLGADNGANQGGQWAGQTNAGAIVSKTFTTANTDVTTEVPLPGFLSTTFVDGLGYFGDGVALMGIAVAKQDGDTVFGANLLATSAFGANSNKLVGLEIDNQHSGHLGPGNATAGEGTSGLYINTFNAPDAGDAIQINAHDGYWANGIKIGGINPTVGAGLSAVPGQTLGSLINTRSGSYGGVAVELGDGESRGIRIQGPAGDNSDAAQIFNSSGFLIIRAGSNPTVFQRHDGANTLLIESGGSLDLTAANTVYKVQGTQVVGSRKPGWTADTGTAKRIANATYSGTAEAAYTQATIQTLMNAVRDLSQTVKALKDDLISHGLLGS